MAFPSHPQSRRIDQMLWRFCSTKEISAETRAYRLLINGRSTALGLRQYRITEEERRLLLERRRERGLIG